MWFPVAINSAFRKVLPASRHPKAGIWYDTAPIRADLFSIERLEQHAVTLAAAQTILPPLQRHAKNLPSLQRRLDDNARALLLAWQESGRELSTTREIVPAAEWLLDNYHLVEAQIREIRNDLPIGYYRLLPKLEAGPLAGYPRVLGIAWAFVAHTDSHFDPQVLRRFLAAYQTVQPLTIGELWAVAITLRIVLIENLRRLSDQMSDGRARRAEANAMADLISAPGQAHAGLVAEIERRSKAPLSEVFAAQLAKRLRDRDPRTNPTLGWLEERLAEQGASIDSVVRHAQERLGASNVTLRNIITGLRRISATDWADLFESVSLVESRLRTHPGYRAMDFASRNLYRGAVEELSRGAQMEESTVVAAVLQRAEASAPDEVRFDPGWYLIAEGRAGFEQEIGFRPPLSLRLQRYGIAAGLSGYLTAILVVTLGLALLSGFALSHNRTGMTGIWLLAMLLPLSTVAVMLVDRMVSAGVAPTLLNGLDLKRGVPSEFRTVVAVPVLITTADDLQARIEDLEVHFLSGTGGDLTFILLTDGVDAPAEVMPADAALLAEAGAAIAALNHRHPPGPAGPRFLHLHRPRRYNAADQIWMGWERKRGKLQALNHLLRGTTDTGFTDASGRPPEVPKDVRYVITLDADTRMPRDTAAQLIGKIAHPLNHPHIDPAQKRVTRGHGILQPRVTPALETRHPATLYERATAGPGGMDPYAAAASDIWQDLFGEGSFTGKGIYHIDAFEAAMQGRVPENSLLSHDLLEGIYTRAGLASDVVLVEGFPERHDIAARRQHRWTRGDWQLLRWLFSPDLSALGRVKIADTLRSSLIAPATLLALWLGWLTPTPALASALVLVTMALPILLPFLLGLLPLRPGLDPASYLRQTLTDLCIVLLRCGLAVVLLADTAYRMGDAILRTLWRLGVSHRNLLQWTTAAQTTMSGPPSPWRLIGFMAGGVALGLLAAASALLLHPAALPVTGPFALFWFIAPLVAFGISLQPRAKEDQPLSPQVTRDLRLIARATWRYFETFVTAENRYLPPDNHQEVPVPLTAQRTSPTNMGLYLLSCVAARDFAWMTLPETVGRLEQTLEAMAALPKHRGHFYNWYATNDGRVLDPGYVSSVDSGNLAGHLIALANACETWAGEPLPNGEVTAQEEEAYQDLLVLARQSMPQPDASVDALLRDLEVALTHQGTVPTNWHAILRRIVKQTAALLPGAARDDLRFWLDSLRSQVARHLQPVDPSDLAARLRALGKTSRDMALAMDFAFLFDDERKLLSIGWSRNENALDPSCYDLLASEARLASFFAIAKGDLPARHWFRLGRAVAPQAGGAVLISWSGSMFEYLMPALVMNEPAGSMLDQTNRQVVARQRRYGLSRGVPWGMSESGFNARDLEMNYQYSTFGVPGMGLKRGMANDLVIAPYATGLAAMFEPQAAHDNYQALAAAGGRGSYGFYEAMDYTPARLPEEDRVAVVRSYMAHHQGMTVVGLANALQEGRMRDRFHNEPMIRAAELLLQERIPRDIGAAAQLPAAATVADGTTALEMQRLTLIQGEHRGPLISHILSNGRYAVMLTAQGNGYSRWGNVAVTRWQADATAESGGSHIWLRDVSAGRHYDIVSAEGAETREVQFFEDRATFARSDGHLSLLTEVLVSGEDDAEVRRVTITSTSRRSREIELTSYAELVLNSTAAEAAHPVFSKMFVQTEFLPEFGALVAMRRPRTPDDATVWAAHFVVVEATLSSGLSYETDRAAFLGRDRGLASAQALGPAARLQGGIGTVLDPVFALRQRISLARGEAAHLAFWTVVAPTREALLELIDRHHDRNAFDRAKTLAWTQAQVQLRHLGVDTHGSAAYQRLTSAILCPDQRFRARRDLIETGAGKQSALWPMGISGDLLIVLLRIDSVADLPVLHEMLLALEYWRSKLLAVDLVILNEHPASYVQGLQFAIEAALRGSRAPSAGNAAETGQVHAVRADLMIPAARALLLSVARVVLIARRGTLAQQIAAILGETQSDAMLPPSPPFQPLAPAMARDTTTPPELALEYFNGYGGFDRDGREYVTILEPSRPTPVPWVNIIANDGFGFQVSASGSATTWAENSRENRLTPWSNDPVSDPTGEAFYLRDTQSGVVISPTASPLQQRGRHIARHGFGYSRFEHEADGIGLELLQFVPLHDPVKISRLRVTNLSPYRRTLSVIAHTDLVMGVTRPASAPYVITALDAETGALFARNPWNIAFPDRVTFADMAGTQSAFTTDRGDFLGRNGSLAAPAALQSDAPLAGTLGAGLDPCLTLSRQISLAPGESIEVLHLLGQTGSPETARALVRALREADLDQLFAEVEAHWAAVLGTVQIKTPDRAMDLMINGWLLYQTLACRVQARAGFWQASGAYGFRDQLQDGMALTTAVPDRVRAHLLRAASRQFAEGDVQHWWLPHSGQGVRTRISDDCVWLGHCVADYVEKTGDIEVLEAQVPYLEGPDLTPEQHDAFFVPLASNLSGSLYDHCAKGLDRAISLKGQHGLPLIGTGDWNDGMNRVGEAGRGESVWLGWLLIETLHRFASFAHSRDPAQASRWLAEAANLSAAIEHAAWDGAWYRRATFDDGSWMGSASASACRIDSIAQSWSVLSGQGQPERARIAMQSLERELVQPENGMALLFTPPFDGDKTGPNPGYIAAYPPGLRENGGQYSHAAMWSIMAEARLGNGAAAARLFSLLNPINHALSEAEVQRYKVEPYVLAADIYSVAPHLGRGGWTWYTGSAAWMYRAAVEGILGITQQGDHLAVRPCLSPDWPGFSAELQIANTAITIEVKRATDGAAVYLDGQPQSGPYPKVPLDGQRHRLEILFTGA